MKRRTVLTSGAALGLAALAGVRSGTAWAADKPVRIGLLAKSLGNGFFVAAHRGAQEAAKELGNVEVIYTGPSSTSAEGQIEIINSLAAQHVDAIAISANDPDALVPACKRAMQRGVKVVSFDSAVATEGRIVHLAPSSSQLIGETCIQLVADANGGHGKFAILSATPTSTNQNEWIAVMKTVLPKFPGLDLISTVYGDDLADKSYRETTALLERNPDLTVIVSPSSVGIVAAAKAVEDKGLTGKVWVTGLGLPSEMAGHVESGSSKSFAIWNPIDLGYAITQIAVEIVHGAKAGPNTTLSMGRLGTVTFDATGVGPMGKPFTYDKSNVKQFAAFF
jgi:rhamnose transport system substrate-binding protein